MKIATIFTVLLLIHLISLNLVEADLLGLLDLLAILLGSVINALKFLLGGILPNLNNADYAQILKYVQELKELGITITREDIIRVAKEVVQINKLAAGEWEAKITFFSLLPSAYRQDFMGSVEPEDEGENGEGQPGIEVRGITPQGRTKKPKIKRSIRVKRASCTYRDEFDSATNWPKCSSIINFVQHQGKCGSCWAYSTATAFSDRHCIARVKNNPRLGNQVNSASNSYSVLDVLSCSMTNGCKGGWPINAWRWIQKNGICTGTDFNRRDGCKPYPFASNSQANLGGCTSRCSNSRWGTPYNNEKNTHKLSSAGELRGEQAIKNEIQRNGPVVVCFTCYSDIMSYNGGVYSKVGNPKKEGGHAVTVVGWGVATCGNKRTNYWKIRNTWGTGWGVGGYVYFKRGNNECGIEDQGSYGIIKL